MTLTVQERKQRVEDSFAKLSEDEATRSIVEELKGIAETELEKEDESTGQFLSHEAQVAEWEAFHDYVLERLDNEEAERLSPAPTGKHRAADEVPEIIENKVNETETKDPEKLVNPEKSVWAEDDEIAIVEDEEIVPVEPVAVKKNERLTSHDIVAHEFADKSKGYNKDQVDDALTELANFLNTKDVTQEALSERLRSITSLEFSQSRMFSKGYDPDEVDHFLEKIEDEISKRLKAM